MLKNTIQIWISRRKSDLRLKSIPVVTFTGIKLLSYYNVSWALLKPEIVGELGLPNEREFAAANSFNET